MSVPQGSETTAYTIANACLLLALHPDVQNKLHSEITQIFPDAHPDISPQSLSSLHETESFLKELLRLYPIAPIIARETVESFELDGVRFPKGTIFLLNFYQLHRRQDLWGADSTRFNPDRFSGERSKEPQHSFAYLPFSGGPRNCIGQWRKVGYQMYVGYTILFIFRTSLRHDDSQDHACTSVEKFQVDYELNNGGREVQVCNVVDSDAGAFYSV